MSLYKFLLCLSFLSLYEQGSYSINQSWTYSANYNVWATHLTHTATLKRKQFRFSSPPMAAAAVSVLRLSCFVEWSSCMCRSVASSLSLTLPVPNTWHSLTACYKVMQVMMFMVYLITEFFVIMDSHHKRQPKCSFSSQFRPVHISTHIHPGLS